MKRTVNFGIVILIAISLIFSGCAGGAYLTTKFQPVQSIPEGKALVYIYRPYKYTGCAVHYTVNANQKPVSDVHLYVKGFVPPATERTIDPVTEPKHPEFVIFAVTVNGSGSLTCTDDIAVHPALSVTVT